ncbi:phosphoribosylformylglycinamidine synthase subunit PurL [Candidatus Woesearchaeota archaeon]|nr:phosphoribosylformylglycinamidine synthase subunit PurL [Candidatus Woesearchaeota archaeon]
MGKVDSEIIDIASMTKKDINSFLSEYGLSLKHEEIEKIVKILGRNPTLTEIYIFNTQWSEHTSYKSSKSELKKLPTKGRDVVLGPGEDAGIVFFTEHNGNRYCIVMSHESHNHPSQVIPYEGAATGVGGNVRDVLCMGARVISSADPLRFGNPSGKNSNKVKYIANSVMDGIAGYGNPLGVPVIAGDIYFNDSFDENCLVNVVTLGLVKENEIIHSKAPEKSDGYDIILVGKATDNSGFGGAAFSSLILDEKQSNKGAIQVPDPFLKNVLVRASEKIFEEARKSKVELGFKDLGAGGILCCTSELVSSSGLGAEINLDSVHVSMHNMPPYMIACSETQERFAWISPNSFTEKILKVYNSDFDLSGVSEGARATAIGKVRKGGEYILKHKGRIICNAPASEITSGISYKREIKKPKREFSEPKIAEPDYEEAILKVLSHPNIASKSACYKHYDTEVQGLTVIRPGEADAGVQTPIHGCEKAIALTVDSNPKYSRIDPYLGGVNAVAEAMRNVAAVGAVPIALTDCLCYGNPEKPEQFHDFCEGVRGLADAAINIWLKGTKEPVPFIGGNVSLYNESSKGKSVDPSPIVSCLGRIDDVSKAITMKIKSGGSVLVMIGKRKDELGGSVFYEINGHSGKNVPLIDFKNERAMIYSVIDCIYDGLFLSCHDISDGGLVTTISEMILGGEADGNLGAEIDIGFSEIKQSVKLFSETSGFVAEINAKDYEKAVAIMKGHGIEPVKLGITGGDSLIIKDKGKIIAEIEMPELRKAWTSGFMEAIK